MFEMFVSKQLCLPEVCWGLDRLKRSRDIGFTSTTPGTYKSSCCRVMTVMTKHPTKVNDEKSNDYFNVSVFVLLSFIRCRRLFVGARRLY